MSKLRPRLILIDDNPDFGGHQVMAAHALEGLLRYGAWEVLAMLHPENEKNRGRWETIASSFCGDRLRIEAAPTRSAKFQAIHRRWQKRSIAELRARVAAERPALVLVIQGNIEQGCSCFTMRGRIPCPVLSYIPVPHRHAEMGAKLGALRDWFCRGLYGEPDGFITISPTLGEMLRSYGAKGRIQIVENGIPLERFQAPPSRSVARRKFDLPNDGFFWAQIGRTEYKQKGQDFSLELFQQRLHSHPDEHLVFLGSGPDSSALEQASAQCPRVHCLPWVDDPSPLYAAVDALLLPSRYEGVPLAMLEALANGLPVASTDRDGMRDWLPSEWRFAYREVEQGLRAMDAVRQANSETTQHLRNRVWQAHSIAAFQKAFNEALETWL